MKENRITILILTAAVVVVWAFIGSKVYDTITSDDRGANVVNVEMKSSEIIEESIRTLEWSIRDPFHPARASRMTPASTPPRATASQKWAPPPLRLTAILLGSRESSAMFERSDGEVIVARRGDEVEGMRVEKINEKEVLYSYSNRQGTFSLE